MGSHGLRGGAATLGEHVCARCDSIESMIAAATSFFARGIEVGAMPLLVVRDPAAVRPLLSSPSWPAEVAVVGFEAIYERTADQERDAAVADPVVTTNAVLDGWRMLIDQALAAGYTGLCVAADATTLVRTGEQRAAFHRYESLVGRFIASHPMSALCLYHGAEMSAQDYADTASVHSDSAGGFPTFRLWFSQPDVLSLAGELDAANQAQLERVLDSFRGVASPSLILDATGLGFMSHNALISLERWASTAAEPVEVRGTSATIGRVAALLGVQHLRLAPVAGC